MAEEKVGRHKGAIETLMHEKKELSRLLQIVNKQMERHMKELEEEGVDADQFIQSLTRDNEQQNKNTGNSRKQSQSNRKQNRNKQQQNKQQQKEEEEEEETDDFAPF